MRSLASFQRPPRKESRQGPCAIAGAGAVAAGGIISLFRAMPTIIQGIKGGLHDVGLLKRSGPTVEAGSELRTDKDLSMKFVGVGCVLLLAGIRDILLKQPPPAASVSDCRHRFARQARLACRPPHLLPPRCLQ